MPDLMVEEKIAEKRRSLKATRTNALNAISQLKVYKVNLASLKTLVANDDDFDQAAEDSVQTVITELLAEIDTI